MVSPGRPQVLSTTLEVEDLSKRLEKGIQSFRISWTGIWLKLFKVKHLTEVLSKDKQKALRLQPIPHAPSMGEKINNRSVFLVNFAFPEQIQAGLDAYATERVEGVS